MASTFTDNADPDAAATLTPKRKIKTVLTYILTALVAIILVFAGVVAMQPNEFRVARSATMSAPPSAIFAQVNDFHHWEAWSPWAKMDPNAKTSFEGSTTGEGAIFSWNGNSSIGEGSMRIIESRPNDLIRIQLDFVRPFAGTNDVTFTFKPVDDQTTVTWAMSGKKSFITKAIGLVMNCEKMVGDQYQQGLANIESIVEAPTGG